MRYIIEVGSADDVVRDDDEYPSGNWECVASGETIEGLLARLLTALNDDDVSIDNHWLRLVENPDVTEVVNY